MCKGTNELGGPRRCSGDTRAAAMTAHERVAVLEAERDNASADLFAYLPADPTIDDVIAVHPEHRDMIEEMASRGVTVGLSDTYRDPDGRPMLTFGRPEPAPEPVSFAGLDREERIKAMHAELEAGIEQLGTAEGWQQFLESRSQFHRYSFGNQILIGIQKPDATQVASFNDWKKHGRTVNKGEKALWVHAPMTRKVKEVDPQTGQEKEKSKVVGFKAVPVFDVSQTSGEPLPAPPAYLDNPLSGQAPPGMHENITSDIGAKGFAIEYTDTGSAGGWTDFKNKKVVISKSASHREQAATLAHELAHIELGHGERLSDYHTNPGGKRPDMEVEAESVAFVIGRFHGMRDHSANSFAYIDGWAKGNKDKVKASADTVVKASRSILDRLAGKGA